jgi:hypothetical protein
MLERRTRVLTRLVAAPLPLLLPAASCPICRPDGKQWLKFDDERVEKADANKAIEDNWGGEDERAPPGGERAGWLGFGDVGGASTGVQMSSAG